MSEQELTRQEVREIAKDEADRAISHRIIPEFPAYFMNSHWLVTYDWMADADQRLSERISQLEQRIAQLERPWWKRW